MEALLPALVAAFLAEWGDKTQLLVVALAARYARPGAILAGVAVAATANAALAAAGGWLIADLVNYRALSLLLALALLFAGAGGMFAAKTPAVAGDWKLGAFAATAAAFALVEFGDKTGFVTAALAARTGSPVLVAAGAALGVIAASVPAAVLGPALARRLPLRAVRMSAAAALLAAGAWLALGALQLV